SGTGTLTINGLLNWTGGQMCTNAACTAPGTLGVTNANGGISIPSGEQFLYGRTLNTMGAVTISSGAAMLFGYGGVVNNPAGGTWTISTNYYLETTTGGGSFNNAGTFVSSAAFAILVQPVFTNTGAVQANSGTGSLNLFAVASSTGTWSVVGGATLLLSSGSGNTATLSGAISGAGTVELGQQIGTLNVTGSYNVTG